MKYTHKMKQFLKDMSHRVRQTLTLVINGVPIRELPRVFFLHFEKCGGSSVEHAFRQYLKNFAYHDFICCRSLYEKESLSASSNQDIPLFEYREMLLHYYLSNENLRFVRGHFQISPNIIKQYGDKWKFVTLLREPVSRWFSHYFYNRYKEVEHGSIEMTVEEYLETARAQALGQDYVDLLTGEGDHEDSSLSVPTSARMTQAKNTINQFDIVGTLENLSNFERMIQEKTSCQIRIGHKNKNPVPKIIRENKVSESIRKKVVELCKPNIKIYQHIKDK